MKAIAIILLSSAVILAVAALPALLLTLVWNNFVALFTSVPHLSFWMAWSILILVHFILRGFSSSEAKS